VVPCGGYEVRDVESDRRVNVHMCRRAEGAEPGKEVGWEEGVTLGWLCRCERQGRSLRAGKVGSGVGGVCF
jgi:hypothetical protein